MGKRKKKLTEGAASNLISRTRALRKLQLSLKDFRRLCILKGIYPRPPKKRLIKKYGTKATFYHSKDILFLSHEPLMKKFREMKIYSRKLNKARNRGDTFKHKMLKQKKPKYNYDHLIRERYPSFLDAIRDLDDCLSMIFLFASLPSGMVDDITGKRIVRCQKLRDEFQAWIVKAGCLRKVFISIKGTYVQANVHGEEVIWVVPHKFVHSTPDGVDYNVLSTFLHFYETLLNFVNFRLYSAVDLHYPPLVDEIKDNAGLGFTKFIIETKEQAENREKVEEEDEDGKMELIKKEAKPIENLDQILNKKKENENEKNKTKMDVEASIEKMEEEEEEMEEQEEKIGEGFEKLGEQGDVVMNETSQQDEEDRGDLFENCHFLLNREVPQELLEFIICACGGNSTRLQFCKNVNDTIFTHHVIDRPMVESKLLETREYIQPQWIVDSLNAGVLLPTRPYRPNVKSPAHLSPFVDHVKFGYVPKQALVTQSWIDGKPLPEEVTSGSDDSKAVAKPATEGAEKEEEEESDGEGEKPLGEEKMRELRMDLASGKRRRLLKAMEMGNNKKDAFIQKLREKAAKVESSEKDN